MVTTTREQWSRAIKTNRAVQRTMLPSPASVEAEYAAEASTKGLRATRGNRKVFWRWQKTNVGYAFCFIDQLLTHLRRQEAG